MGERHLSSGSGGFVTVGRGPVPRHATHYDAADPHPENLDNLGNPASDLNDREGQALALR